MASEHKVTSFRLTCSCGGLFASAADWDRENSQEFWLWMARHFGHGAKVDALQAENERLRQEAINAKRARIVSLRDENASLQARVTLLEGLLREVDTHDIEHEPACHPAAGCSCDVYELGARIDAALSRSQEVEK